VLPLEPGANRATPLGIATHSVPVLSAARLFGLATVPAPEIVATGLVEVIDSYSVMELELAAKMLGEPAGGGTVVVVVGETVITTLPLPACASSTV